MDVQVKVGVYRLDREIANEGIYEMQWTGGQRKRSDREQGTHMFDLAVEGADERPVVTLDRRGHRALERRAKRTVRPQRNRNAEEQLTLVD